MTIVVASYDVFDTCLVRAVGDPQDVHRLLGASLLAGGILDLSPERFAHARQVAEDNARRNAGAAEYTLVGIARELSRSLGVDADVSDRIMAAECALEARLLRPVPAVAADVETARRAGRTIAFLSDMYLPSSFIVTQLDRHGLFEAGDVVMVSCETGAPKWSGAAFERLAEARGVPLGAIVHHGDHPRSDVIVPRRLGVRVAPIDVTQLNRYESLLERDASVTGGLSSSMAGASRLTRLDYEVAGPHQVAIRDVAAGVVAPAMVGFLLWALRRAEQLGLRRLYFVARDGEILIDVARRLAAKLDIDIELTYIYGSRLAWWLPSVSSVGEDELEWAFATHRRIDIRTIMIRLNLTGDGAAAVLARAGLAGKDREEELAADELVRLRAAVADPQTAELLMEAAGDARDELLGYARQVGMLDGTPAGLVDIGWIGRMHVSLGKVLRSAGARPPIGLFFGISGGAPNGVDGDREAYLFDARGPSGYVEDVDAVVNMFDVFCTGFGGQTTGYRSDEHGTVAPVLAPDHDAAKMAWGLDALQGAVAHFADVVVLDRDLVDTGADVRAAIHAVVFAFLHHPTGDEARAWGAFPREDEAGAQEHRLAAPYSLGYLLDRARNDTSARDFRYWKQGSVAITGWPLRWVVETSPRVAGTARRGRAVVERTIRRARG